MSSIFSTQKRQTFLRRKYCFFWVATALSPPVGRCDALPGFPLDSAIFYSLGAPGMPGDAGVSVICCKKEGAPGAAAGAGAAALLAARLSRIFLRFSRR